MPEIAKLWATIGADTDGLKRGLSEADRSLEKSHKSLLNLGNAAKVAALGLVGGGAALAYGLKECVEEAAAAQKVQAQLNSVLQSTNSVAGITARRQTR